MRTVIRCSAVAALGALLALGCKKEASEQAAPSESKAAAKTEAASQQEAASKKAAAKAEGKDATETAPKDATKAATKTPPPSPQEPVVDEATKQKVIEAAIDLGCLAKKAGVPKAPAQEAAAVLASVGLDAAKFDGLWAKVANDPSVKQKVEMAVAQCPSKADLQKAAVIGIIVQNRCLQQAKVKPERAGELKREALANAGLTPQEFVALRDKFKADPDFKARVEEGIKHCPALDPKDLVTEKEAKERVAKKQPLRAKFFGHMFGSANGTITVQVQGSKASAVAKFKAGAVGVKGRVTKDGKVFLQGMQGGNFFRAFGKLDATRTRMSGTWVATLGGKKRQGSFVATR